MKKLLMLSGAFSLLAIPAAQAQVTVTFGEPAYVPTYVAPAPDYPSEHYEIHRHRHNDYWAHRRREEHDDNDHGDRGHR